MGDDDEVFRSAMEWPEDRPYQEPPTGEFKNLSEGLIAAINQAAAGLDMSWRTESPIETLLGARLRLAMDKHFAGDFDVSEARKTASAAIVLAPQFQIDRFRYDFAILVFGQPFVLIECDGKEFHSTKEQVENDGRKNAAAKSAGIELLRFDGSTIYRDTDGCVRKTLEALLRAGRERGLF